MNDGGTTTDREQPPSPAIVQFTLRSLLAMFVGFAVLCWVVSITQCLWPLALIWTAPVAIVAWSLRRRPLRMLISMLVMIFGAGFILIGATPRRHDHPQWVGCANTMRHVAFALLNYEKRVGNFPPSVRLDSNGKPLHSWRTLLLADLDRPDVLGAVELEQPWDSPVNAKANIFLDVYRCPSGTANLAPLTNYVVVTGPGTAFPAPGKVTRLADFKDGPAKTILLVEIDNTNIGWMEPRDLTLAEALQGINPKQVPGMSSHHPEGVNVIFADGHHEFVRKDTPRAKLKAMFTIAGDD